MTDTLLNLLLTLVTVFGVGVSVIFGVGAVKERDLMLGALALMSLTLGLFSAYSLYLMHMYG